MPGTSKRHSFYLRWALVWAATLTLTIAVYWPGLSGDFLFDDNPHIVRNELVQIDSLSPADLRQAWSSSTFDFPNSRPLAMVTFGVNHAFSGLDPFAFKATNLALHLLTGLVLFAVARRLGELFVRLEGRENATTAIRWWVWLATTLWLLHPLNLSPVLLSVQRMTILSTLFVLLGMLAYLVGRQRLSAGGPHGLLWVWISPLFAGIGLLAKENALLLPLLLFVTEWTLLRFRHLEPWPKRHLWLFFLVVTALPILAAIGYLLTHPGYLGFAGRPFDMTERVLTQARALWFYARLILLPDISAMGLFHDDFTISRSLLDPWTTLPAVVGVISAAVAAIVLRKRLPLVSFAVLFFLAGHSLESSVFPLELVYEHRNYLPAIAPLFALAYVPTIGVSALPLSRRLLNTLVAAILITFAALTAMRAYDWSSFGRLIATEIVHHPDSTRLNFQYAQILIAQLDDPSLRADAAEAARFHLQRVAVLDPENINGPFGQVVLDLSLGRLPEAAVLSELASRLRTSRINPLNANLDHFAFLIELQLSAGHTALPVDQMLALYDATLANPTVTGFLRAGVYNSLRAYHQFVLGDSVAALQYADRAIRDWPDNWHLHDRKIRLLAIMGQFDEAQGALQSARQADKLGVRGREASELADLVEAARRGEPVPALPPKRNQAPNGSCP